MKTVPSPRTPDEVFAPLSDAKRADGEYLVSLFREVTGLPPVVWGAKIIGFGSYDYRYASGHTGTAAQLGFAVSERTISLYLSCDASQFATFLDALGPVKTGKGCIYITRLARVDTAVLRELIEYAWEQARSL
ncbi:DUF1801 domain-containing protein [Corynebacterium epidermidicanis]|uniref:YdhG-like domain-containing protein n=1 Tax=Corynebacterium epidermidicanis TaxID=1050174 RepID=A0A0G3GRY1_9CORY|nr:DUF1801 domain-containing protein [Corynebacterium epidermidicanis]AKK03874.1 protein of unknown function (DU1801) [Corynebacterium epidermidicanis]